MIYKKRELKVGDILININGKKKVLEVLTQTCAVSYCDNFESICTWYTIFDLEAENYEYSNKEQWKPKKGVFYWYKGDDGTAHSTLFSNNSNGDDRLSIGNAFRTEEEYDAAEVILPAKQS